MFFFFFFNTKAGFFPHLKISEIGCFLYFYNHFTIGSISYICAYTWLKLTLILKTRTYNVKNYRSRSWGRIIITPAALYLLPGCSLPWSSGCHLI